MEDLLFVFRSDLLAHLPINWLPGSGKRRLKMMPGVEAADFQELLPQPRPEGTGDNRAWPQAA